MRSRIAAPFVAPLIAALVVIADQLSKHWIVTQLPEGQSWFVASWLAPLLKFTHVTNTGVAFGLFQNLGFLFVIVRVVVIAIIIIYERQLPPGQWLTRVVLGLPLGGAIGNLVDRVRLGSVVDFIDLNFWPLETFPVFNLADASIVVGVAILILLMLLEERRDRMPGRSARGGT